MHKIYTRVFVYIYIYIHMYIYDMCIIRCDCLPVIYFDIRIMVPRVPNVVFEALPPAPPPHAPHLLSFNCPSLWRHDACRNHGDGA